ncbi:MAG: hypothetical protein QGG54_13705 [Gammaproteobacteria bacterium]|jgi:hypothetical protein|nr:hypothetical protein [Gammaproteobacteria bacterium]MDP6654231.1 hypothetical protein [Gammaproteobacteria bacterium]
MCCRIFNTTHVEQIFLCVCFNVALDLADGGLGGGQIACGENDKLLFAVEPEAKHLGVGGNLTNTCVG